MLEPGWARVPDDIAYRTIREDITALLGVALLADPLLADADAVADVPVPACPGWSIRDAVSHLAEVGARVLAKASGSPPQSLPPALPPVVPPAVLSVGPPVPPPVPQPGASLAQLFDVWRGLGEGVEAHLRAQNGRGTGGDSDGRVHPRSGPALRHWRACAHRACGLPPDVGGVDQGVWRIGSRTRPAGGPRDLRWHGMGVRGR